MKHIFSFINRDFKKLCKKHKKDWIPASCASKFILNAKLWNNVQNKKRKSSVFWSSGAVGNSKLPFVDFRIYTTNSIECYCRYTHNCYGNRNVMPCLYGNCGLDTMGIVVSQRFQNCFSNDWFSSTNMTDLVLWTFVMYVWHSLKPQPHANDLSGLPLHIPRHSI